jgi:nucleoside-diphosphate-sugar epimerase
MNLTDIGADVVAGADVIFHLAAAVSGECEADFDLGLDANLRASMALLEACRHAGSRPVFVFASSLAVFGQWPGQPLPDVVTDTTLPTPVTSYGIQKYVLEQLVTDYTRKGFIVGRPVRLATVCVRPGRPNAAASGFLSGIIREPLAGQRAICPVAPETAVALSSPSRTIAGLLRAASASSAEFGPPIALNLPSISTTVAAMVDALSTVAGPATAALIDWVPDPFIASIVANWPARVAADRAAALGLGPDADFAAIVREHLDG